MKGADWAINWAVFLGLFIAIEGQALVRRDYEGTLTAHLRQWASIGHKGKWWRARRFTLLSFLAWLVVHLLAPAGTFALLLLAVPAAAESLVMPAEYRQPLTIEVWGDVDAAKPSTTELQCRDGAVVEVVCYGPGGKKPCVRRAALLTPAEVVAWRHCGGMTILGTVGLLHLAHFSGDLMSTMVGCENGLLEANGWAGDPCTNPGRLIALKEGTIGVSLFLVHYLERRWPRVARWMRRFAIALPAGATISNYILTESQRGRIAKGGQ